MKNIVLPLVCLLIGGASGYGVRSLNSGGPAQSASDNFAETKPSSGTHPPSGASVGGSVSEKTSVRAADSSALGTTMSLGDRMKELLADYDLKSAQKAAAKLSASELQGALALLATMPKSSDRDLLRAQLYRAWAALNPNAAWQAALADPLDKNRGYLLAAVAGEMAKKNPAAAIDLALSLGMGGRRSTVMSTVFSEWSKVDVAAAIAYCNAHPDLPVDSFSFYSGLSTLAEKDPMQAANIAITLKDSMTRSSTLTSFMDTWMSRDHDAALNWAQALSNPNQRREATISAIASWAKIDPVAALGYASSHSDSDIRTTALQNAWREWFRNAPNDATAYLGSAGDKNLLENVTYSFSSLTSSFSPKERAELLAQIPEGKAKEDIMRVVTDSQIRKGQFNQALEMLNSMPDSSGRDRNVHSLGEEWAKADLTAAAAWLKLQPDSTDRDLAVSGYSATLARTDPPGALEWIKTIPDEKLRTSAMKNIAVRWLKNDAPNAEAWMASVREFSDSDKKFIRSMASMRGDYLPTTVTVGTRR